MAILRVPVLGLFSVLWEAGFLWFHLIGSEYSSALERDWKLEGGNCWAMTETGLTREELGQVQHDHHRLQKEAHSLWAEGSHLLWIQCGLVGAGLCSRGCSGQPECPASYLLLHTEPPHSLVA